MRFFMVTAMWATVVCFAAGEEGATPLERGVEACGQIADPRVRVRGLCEVVQVAGKHRQPLIISRAGELAIAAARQTSEAGLRADACAAISVAWALAGNREEHERWMHEAIEAGAWSDRRMYWPKLAEARLAGGDIDGAGQLGTAIPDDAVKATTLARLAETCARRGDLSSYDDFMRLAMRSAGRVDQPSQAKEQIVAAQVSAGDLRGATRMTDTIDEAFWRARAQANVAVGYKRNAEAGEYRIMIERARTSSNRAPGGARRAEAMLSVARIAVQGGDVEVASERLGQAALAIEEAEEGRRAAFYLMSSELYRQLQDAANAKLMSEKAIALFGGARAQLAQVDVVAAMVGAGDCGGALKLAEKIESPLQRAVAMSHVARGYEAAGDLESLKKLLPLLDENGWGAAVAAGRAHARAGELKAIEEMASRVKEPAVRAAIWCGAADR